MKVFTRSATVLAAIAVIALAKPFNNTGITKAYIDLPFPQQVKRFTPKELKDLISTITTQRGDKLASTIIQDRKLGFCLDQRKFGELKKTAKWEMPETMAELRKHLVVDCLPKLGTPQNPAQSCKQIKQRRPEYPSGEYWLGVRGRTFKVTCDMKTLGGGWTVIFDHDNNIDQCSEHKTQAFGVGSLFTCNSKEFRQSAMTPDKNDDKYEGEKILENHNSLVITRLNDGFQRLVFSHVRYKLDGICNSDPKADQKNIWGVQLRSKALEPNGMGYKWLAGFQEHGACLPPTKGTEPRVEGARDGKKQSGLLYVLLRDGYVTNECNPCICTKVLSHLSIR